MSKLYSPMLSSLQATLLLTFVAGVLLAVGGFPVLSITVLAVEGLGYFVFIHADLSSLRKKWRTGGGGILNSVTGAIILVILGVAGAIFVYAFIALSTQAVPLSTNAQGNVSKLGNSGAQMLQFVPLIALAIFIAIVMAVLIGVFQGRRGR
jgi:hypothetical protein